ncbi:MAG: hypothetical protein MR938_01880 [Tenericutes bacterium]|nr:hypothetical protein [Mycoplasmatota bacterium]
MNMKSIVKNLVFLILISICFSLGVFFIISHNLKAKYSYGYNIFYLTAIIIIFFGAIGAILGINNKNISSKNISKVRLNKSKLLLLGLPSLIFSLSYIWLYLGIFRAIPILYSYITEINYLVIISSIVLGNTLVSSIELDKRTT